MHSPFNFHAAELLICRNKHRKAWVLPNCLSTGPGAMTVSYRAVGAQGKVLTKRVGALRIPHVVEVQCFPFGEVLKAIGVTKVDYFSLDVEGRELDVLKTVPFDEIDITVTKQKLLERSARRLSIIGLLQPAFMLHLCHSLSRQDVSVILFLRLTDGAESTLLQICR